MLEYLQQLWMFLAPNKKGHSSHFKVLQCFDNSNMYKNRFGSYKTEVKEIQQQM